VGADYLIKLARERVAGPAPRPDVGQSKLGAAAERGRVEVLMCNGVSPAVQTFEAGTPLDVSRLALKDQCPEVNP
jgi:hypothetical protein